MKQIIKDWAEGMVQRYNWLVVKYEYSNKFGTFLVSFSPIEKIDIDEDFNKDALEFNDKMVALYGDSAPLFTDEERLFSLSQNADIVRSAYYTDCGIVKLALGIGAFVNWCNSKTKTPIEHTSTNGLASIEKNVFEIAA